MRGFTLIELAVAVAIVALLLGSILIPLQTQVESRKYDETQRILDQAREALLGYAAAYGYFPCPADAASNGQEPSGTNHATGVCPVWYGFLPAATLGFTPTDSQGYALDAWGTLQNRIRYAVSNATVNGVTNPFTRTNGMRMALMPNISSASLFHVCSSGTGISGSDCGSAVTLTSNAPVVIWSLGPNAATGGTPPHEDKNLDNNRVFVMRTKSDVPGNVFDDIVTWIPTATLFNRLIAAGQLP